MSNKPVLSCGFVLFVYWAAQVLLIMTKLSGGIDWPWMIVLLPVEFAVVLTLLVIFAAMMD